MEGSALSDESLAFKLSNLVSNLLHICPRASHGKSLGLGWVIYKVGMIC